MTEPTFEDLARLWRSGAAEPRYDLADRAMALRQRGMRRAALESLLTIVLLAALARELSGVAYPGEIILICVLALAAAGAQLRLVLLRRALWRDIGAAPIDYWTAVAAKSRLGLRIARSTYLGGPLAIFAGAALAYAAGGAPMPSVHGLVLLGLAAVGVAALGLRDARREQAELSEADRVLRELRS